MQKKFLTYGLLFFLPVVMGYLALEYLIGELPAPYSVNEAYLQKEKNNLEVLVLGSSQIQHAINPEWLSDPTLNMASGDQHHDTDFKLLKAIIPQLPKLKTVVLEVSYSHFELPHNGPDFWKNPIYLRFYNINTYERRTYFKDRFLFGAQPKFFSKKLDDYYLKGLRTAQYNAFAFNENAYQGLFQDLAYDEEKIANMQRFKINTQPNLEVFHQNTALFQEMLEYLKSRELRVIISHVPMYRTYHEKRQPNILRRRDSVMQVALRSYNNVQLFDIETDTTHFEVNDYWNQSHLNPKGAKKYTALLEDILVSEQ